MRRLVSVLLMMIVLISHGTMGSAAPHAGDSAHSMGAFEHHAEAMGELADLHADAAIAATDSPSDKAPLPVTHHVHLIAAFVPDGGLRLDPPLREKGRQLPRNDAWLRSATLKPLPEPPAA